MQYTSVSPTSEATSQVTTADVPVISVPKNPHMTEAGISFFRSVLNNAACYLEFGAGGSTRLAARLGVPHVFSVESDKDFAKAVRRHVSHEKHRGEILVKAVDIGKTRDWGYPSSNEYCRLWPDYPLKIWDSVSAAGVSPDVVLIDGRFRAACFLITVIKTNPGTTILFDDYLGREDRYGFIENIAHKKVMIDKMAVFETPASVNYILAAELLARSVFDPR